MKAALLLTLLQLAQAATPTVQMPQKPFEVPMQQPVQKLPLPPAPVPENLENWPKSCQRLHLETNKCENGLKSCNQRRIAYWRKKCESDEPHGQ